MKERHYRGMEPFGLPLIMIRIYYTSFLPMVKAGFIEFSGFLIKNSTTRPCRVHLLRYW